MDKDGFIEGPVHCKRCKKQLHGQGSGYPAETYLGTYNGLCYPCTNAEPYVVRTDLLDGAEHWSHPPSCPSWRRDREPKIGYADCPKECKAGVSGRRYPPGQFGQSYPEQCQACFDRYHNHPVRVWRWRRASMIYDAANKVYRSRLVSEKLARWIGKGKNRRLEDIPGEAEEAMRKKLRAELLERHRKIMDRFLEIVAKRGIE